MIVKYFLVPSRYNCTTNEQGKEEKGEKIAFDHCFFFTVSNAKRKTNLHQLLSSPRLETVSTPQMTYIYIDGSCHIETNKAAIALYYGKDDDPR
jgi:hypothetical protein